MINLPGLKTLHDLWKRFSGKHNDLISFGTSLYPHALQEGTLVAVYVRTPDNQTFDYNLTLDAEDAQMLREADKIVRNR